MSANKTKFKPPSLTIVAPTILKDDIIIEKINSLNIPKEIARIAKYINEQLKIKPTSEINPAKQNLLTISKSLQLLLNSLKIMSSSNVDNLYAEIEIEKDKVNSFEFTIVRCPLSERLIAHVLTLSYDGIDLLKGKNIMLYQSTGTSRGTGLENYWMPYTGNKANNNVGKLEDKYISAIELLIDKDIIDDKILIIDIIEHIIEYSHYMRFINKTYLIASFLLNIYSDVYIKNPDNQKYIREYDDEEKKNANMNIGSKFLADPDQEQIAITAAIIDEIIQPPSKAGSSNYKYYKYYKKYLKYKNKYISLKNS